MCPERRENEPKVAGKQGRNNKREGRDLKNKRYDKNAHMNGRRGLAVCSARTVPASSASTSFTS